MKKVVRIQKIKLVNFKNTANGVITMPRMGQDDIGEYSADILGIYGQNGSGKTAVIEALGILQELLSGERLDSSGLAGYIMQGRNRATIGATFSIDQEFEGYSERYLVDYDVTIGNNEHGEGRIEREVLKAEKEENGKTNRKTLIDYNALSGKAIFTPLYRYESVAKTEEDRTALTVAQKISQRDTSSFIFCQEGLTHLERVDPWDDFSIARIVDGLFGFAGVNLHVVTRRDSALISVSDRAPILIRIENEKGAMRGAIPLPINGPAFLEAEYFKFLRVVLVNMNQVLREIIPGLEIDLHSYGKELNKEGKEGIRAELISKRGETLIPVRYESEGIIKIVTILHILICAYTDPSICLVVDELDSGIYEYLLGELLSVMQNHGKGQLIFTSHNLRPLEMLTKESIVFSTANPDNRYIRLQYVKNNNNLRDMYLRSILLGGQKEELYQETDTNQIARAFRRAGKAATYGG